MEFVIICQHCEQKQALDPNKLRLIHEINYNDYFCGTLCSNGECNLPNYKKVLPEVLNLMIDKNVIIHKVDIEESFKETMFPRRWAGRLSLDLTETKPEEILDRFIAECGEIPLD